MKKLSKFNDISIKKSDQQKITGGGGFKPPKEPKPIKIKLSKDEKACLKELGQWTNNGNGNGVW